VDSAATAAEAAAGAACSGGGEYHAGAGRDSGEGSASSRDPGPVGRLGAQGASRRYARGGPWGSNAGGPTRLLQLSLMRCQVGQASAPPLLACQTPHCHFIRMVRRTHTAWARLCRNIQAGTPPVRLPLRLLGQGYAMRLRSFSQEEESRNARPLRPLIRSRMERMLDASSCCAVESACRLILNFQ